MKPELYTGRVKIISHIGSYYYGIGQLNNSFHICIQKVGDVNWLVKEEEFTSGDAAKAQIKFIEKEHYDAIKFEASR